MRINDIVVLENNKRYILTNKYELDNNIYYVDDSKKKFNFIKNKNLKIH